MKKGRLEKVLIYVVILLSVFQFTNCTKQYNIEIITEDDKTYIEFDSLSFFPAGGNDWKKSAWQAENKRIMSDLYIASDRGRKKFEYVFYVNKNGEYEKARIVKSLNEDLDLQYVNFTTKSFSGKGKLGDKIVKYKRVINNELLSSFPNWENATNMEIPIVNEEDNSYKTFSNPKLIQLDFLKKLDRKKWHDSYEKQFGTQQIINKRLRKSFFDLQYMERTFINDLPIGFTTSYYTIYVNENGKLDKVRVIDGLPSKLNYLLMSYLPVIKFPKYMMSGDSTKYKFILRTNILVNYPGQIDEISHSMSYDESVIKELVKRKNEIIEVTEKIDSTVADFSELDNITEIPNVFYWSGVLPILNKEAKKEFDLLYQSVNKSTNFVYSEESDDEFSFILFIDRDGFVEKVYVEKGHGENLNNSVLKIIEGIHYLKGEIGDRPVKYKAIFKLRLFPNRGRENSPLRYRALIRNPLFRKNIYELPEAYSEKDFFVLPDVSAKPIGGYSKIAEKVKYPDIAIRYKKEGEVSVKTYLSETGDIIGVQVLRAEGYGFEEAAVSAIKKTKFEPAYQNGKPIKSIYVVPIEFILDSGEIKIRREQIDAYQKEGEPEPKENNKPLQSFNKDDIYFVAVEEMPSPIGGVEGIQNKITYPSTARMAGVEGRVFVKAFIDENGDVKKTELLKGIGAGCDEEAMKAMSETKFKPGRQKGKAVKVQISIPILFSLKSTDDIDSTKHFGYWIGESDKGEEIKIWFLKNGSTELYKGKSGRVYGEVTGATFWPKFKINYYSKPSELDLEYYGGDGKLKGKQLCIMKYNSSKKMEIGLPKELSKRPKNFSKSEVGEIWTLRKIKD